MIRKSISAAVLLAAFLEFTVGDQTSGRSLPPSGGSDGSTNCMSVEKHKVLLGRTDDGWPSSVTLYGVVERVVPGECGFICQAGLLRIRVDPKRAGGYPASTLYAFAYCIEPEDVKRYCGHTVRVQAVKSLATRDYCGIPLAWD